MEPTPHSSLPIPHSEDPLDALTPEQIAAAEKREIAAQLARATALPGPLRDALGGRPITCHGLTFRPVLMGDVILLEQLGHPLHRWLIDISGRQQGREPELGLQEMFDLVFLWTHPFEECEALVERGLAAFRSAVKQFIKAKQIPVAAIPLLGVAIKANMDRGFATQTQFEAIPGEGFQSPPAAQPTTAPAGG